MIDHISTQRANVTSHGLVTASVLVTAEATVSQRLSPLSPVSPLFNLAIRTRDKGLGSGGVTSDSGDTGDSPWGVATLTPFAMVPAPAARVDCAGMVTLDALGYRPAKTSKTYPSARRKRGLADVWHRLPRDFGPILRSRIGRGGRSIQQAKRSTDRSPPFIRTETSFPLKNSGWQHD